MQDVDWRKVAEEFRTGDDTYDFMAISMEVFKLRNELEVWKCRAEINGKKAFELADNLQKFSIHGSDGCLNCETGRITIFAKSRWCLECLAKKEK